MSSSSGGVSRHRRSPRSPRLGRRKSAAGRARRVRPFRSGSYSGPGRLRCILPTRGHAATPAIPWNFVVQPFTEPPGAPIPQRPLTARSDFRPSPSTTVRHGQFPRGTRGVSLCGSCSKLRHSTAQGTSPLTHPRGALAVLAAVAAWTAASMPGGAPHAQASASSTARRAARRCTTSTAQNAMVDRAGRWPSGAVSHPTTTRLDGGPLQTADDRER